MKISNALGYILVSASLTYVSVSHAAGWVPHQMSHHRVQLEQSAQSQPPVYSVVVCQDGQWTEYLRDTSCTSDEHYRGECAPFVYVGPAQDYGQCLQSHRGTIGLSGG